MPGAGRSSARSPLSPDSSSSCSEGSYSCSRSRTGRSTSETVSQRPPAPDMKALVYHGPSQRGWDTVADPTIIDPTDIVVRIDTSTICGSELHILKGDVPETTPGTGLGH